jgi:hypothetical protein
MAGSAPRLRSEAEGAAGFGSVLARADRRALYYWQVEKKAGGKVRCTGHLRRPCGFPAHRPLADGGLCASPGSKRAPLRRDPSPAAASSGHLQPPPGLRVRPRGPGRGSVRQRERLVRRFASALGRRAADRRQRPQPPRQAAREASERRAVGRTMGSAHALCA